MAPSIPGDAVFVDPSVTRTALLKYCPMLIVPILKCCTMTTASESCERKWAISLQVKVEIRSAQNIDDVNAQPTICFVEMVRECILITTADSLQICNNNLRSSQAVIAGDVRPAQIVVQGMHSTPSARSLAFDEMMNLLSGVRLGLSLKLIRGVRVETLNRIMIFAQQAHLQRAAGRTLDEIETDVRRASPGLVCR